MCLGLGLGRPTIPPINTDPQCPPPNPKPPQPQTNQIAELGIYPAVDPLDSTSRLLDPEYISLEHYKTTRDTQKLLQDYKSLQDIIAILGTWCCVFMDDGWMGGWMADLSVGGSSLASSLY